jgi:hypothetical protein
MCFYNDEHQIESVYGTIARANPDHFDTDPDLIVHLDIGMGHGPAVKIISFVISCRHITGFGVGAIFSYRLRSYL